MATSAIVSQMQFDEVNRKKLPPMCMCKQFTDYVFMPRCERITFFLQRQLINLGEESVTPF